MDFSETELIGVILAVIACFVIFGFIKGIFRLFYGFLCLVIITLTAWAGYTIVAPVIHTKWPKLPDFTSSLIAAVSGVLAFFILKVVTDFFVDPFDSKDEDKKGSRYVGVVTGFLIGCSVCLFSFYKLADSGSRAEIQYWLSQAETKASTKLPKIAHLKNALMKTAMGKRIASFLPIDDLAQQTLTKLAIMNVTSPEQLQTIAQNAHYHTVLNSTYVQQFLNDSEINDLISRGDIDAIRNHPKLQKLLSDPETNQAIAQIDIEQVLKLR